MMNHMNRSQSTQDTIPELDTMSMEGEETSASEPDWFALRKQRIEQHRQDSLADSDARTSVVGTVGADLMLLQLQVGEALRDVLGSGRVSPELLSRNQGGIEMLLKLSKLVTQLSQLHRKMRLDAAATEESKAGMSEETEI